MMGESGHFTGSVCLSRRSDRHGSPKNRHSYFTNPSICPLISGMMPRACPEKAAFGTVWREDNSQNGLQYAGGRIREIGVNFPTGWREIVPGAGIPGRMEEL